MKSRNYTIKRNGMLLNSNIRCIEIIPCLYFWHKQMCWIVTLDVLKYRSILKNKIRILLNSNIRCIEIQKTFALPLFLISWIVTLDVLKLFYAECVFKSDKSWIVTLDVLKWCKYNRDSRKWGLNSNIRCIEIMLIKRQW